MILVVGLAGSGKSTLSEMLEASGHFQWLSIGQMLRSAILDPKLKAIIDSGDVLDDSIVIPMVAENLQKRGDKPELILDGFPRTLSQVSWLLSLEDDQKINLNCAIHIKASQEIVYSRLIKRGRTDDHEAAINERFNEYENMILPILQLLKDKGIRIVEANGENSPEVVHQEVLAKLGLSNG